ELVTDRHQRGHLALGDGDLLASPFGEGQVGDGEIGGGGSGVGGGAHRALLSLREKGSRAPFSQRSRAWRAPLAARCNAPRGRATLSQGRSLSVVTGCA